MWGCRHFKSREDRAPSKKQPGAPEIIELRGDDNSFERARKLWRLMGFVNDRHGMVGRLAEHLEWYRQADIQMAKQEKKDPSQSDPT